MADNQGSGSGRRSLAGHAVGAANLSGRWRFDVEKALDHPTRLARHVIVEDAAHSACNPGIEAELARATDRFAAR